MHLRLKGTRQLNLEHLVDLGSRLDDEEKLHTRWARDVFDIGRGGVRGGLERVETWVEIGSMRAFRHTTR